MTVQVQTLWRTSTEQCELVSLGLQDCRLRLWVNGVLILDEPVPDGQTALMRAEELRREWRRP
jgi:hypothetical protein